MQISPIYSNPRPFQIIVSRGLKFLHNHQGSQFCLLTTK